MNRSVSCRAPDSCSSVAGDRLMQAKCCAFFSSAGYMPPYPASAGLSGYLGAECCSLGAVLASDDRVHWEQISISRRRLPEAAHRVKAQDACSSTASVLPG